MNLNHFDWLQPEAGTKAGPRELLGSFQRKPKGWGDEVINGPVPEQRNNEMQKLINRWRNLPSLTETEARLMGWAKAADWKYDDEEY